ncbi:MAG: DNA topoisomerase (ATP-hydrolyzing) subunit B [Candidatus Omnitrophica bacterium]|nr:DNA topoisomerase (ATP-hydrolyzing) subunit B [Candidatus Omnitrophota bacterium]MCM8801845.1 DNA topoisomerase (ATP-hydrolyzing) subunit B [Candidatus Omnitrophota bacterium]
MEDKRNLSSYDASSIQVLGGIEAVRKRPAMYIGDTSIGGLHHLVFEVVDNSIDEAMAGFCDEINVIIHPDNIVTIEDNGRGIPVDQHLTEKKPAVEVVMTTLHAGGKFDKKVYKVSGGLHGVGVSVVNALSEYLEVEIKRDGKVYYQKYEKGKPVTPLKVIGKTEKTGTKITFKPDEEIFETIVFDENILIARLKELAFLNAGIKITFLDDRKNIREEFKYTGGLISFVEYLNKNKRVLHSKPFYIKKIEEDIEVESVFQYNDGYSETLISFANNVNTREGGTHLTGFRSGLTRALNEYGKNNGFLEGMNLTGEDVKEGLTGIIAVKLPEPQFEGQTKAKLGNSKVRFIVEGIIYESVLTFLEENPEAGREILNKCIATAKAREAARKARELTRKKLLETGALPGKLADCSTKEPEKRELFIVEGDSAGGSAKQGRDRTFQAILPLKGKIINTEKASLEKVLNNDEIKTMISAIGGGVGDDFDISKVRYHKIIIMTDADIDGAHIKTLLLTFFYRQMTDLIKHGYVYIAEPPLYKVKKGKKEFYINTENELDKVLVQFAAERVKLFVSYDSKLIEYNEQIPTIFEISKKLSEIIRTLSLRGIDIKKIISFYKKNKKTPSYFLIYNNEKLFLTDEEEVTEYLNQKGEEFDLFSKSEDKKYKLFEIYESKELQKIFKKLEEIKAKVDKVFEKIFLIRDEKGKEEKLSIIEIYDKIKEKEKEGFTIQRYKGLGEMNPEQLWETTMNPQTRRLKKITIEDAIKAEEIFTVLMGELVEPRREFIEKYAREVKNLDI